MPPSEHEARQVDLEVQFSFLDEHVRQQDKEILKLRDQVEKLILDVKNLRSEQLSGGIPLPDGERPPHY